METVIALLVVILIGFWAVNILKPRKANKKEKTKNVKLSYEEVDFFKLQLKETLKGIDIDGEGYQSEVWEATEEEK